MDTSGRSGSVGTDCGAAGDASAGPLHCDDDPPRSTLRGLNNLGNTCFMNCVLQMLLHAPPLKAFFLGVGHEGGAPGCTGDLCIACAMDALFAEMHDGLTAPFSPANLMMSWWSFADDLSGYKQQDAHEFYLSLLSGLHDLGIACDEPLPGVSAQHAALPPLAGSRCGTPEHPAVGMQPAPPPIAAATDGVAQPHPSDAPAEPSRCGSPTPPLSPLPHGTADSAPLAGCAPPGAGEERTARLVDAVFGGLLHSEVTCLACGTTSVASDPFLDISLEIVEPSGGRSGSCAPGQMAPAWAGAAGGAAATSGRGNANGVHSSSQRGGRGDAADVKCDDDDTAASLERGGGGGVGGRVNASATPSRQRAMVGKSPAKSAAKEPKQAGGIAANLKRSERCGSCHTCLNRYLKKRCLNPKPLGSAGGAAAAANVPSQSEAAPSPSPAATPPPSAPREARRAMPAMDHPRCDGGGEDGGGASGSTVPTAEPSSEDVTPSLVGSLARFVQPEQLPAGGNWVCASCRCPQAAVKQLSIRRLPLVLALHIKRFEHGEGGCGYGSTGYNGAAQSGVARKLQSSLQFPLSDLDMGPFTTAELLRLRASASGAVGAAAAAPDDDAAGSGARGSFALLGCVCHIGEGMMGGHYISYIKFEGSWYCCNDALVTHADAATVRSCQPYMLFYTSTDVCM